MRFSDAVNFRDHQRTSVKLELEGKPVNEGIRLSELSEGEAVKTGLLTCAPQLGNDPLLTLQRLCRSYEPFKGGNPKICPKNCTVHPVRWDEKLIR